MSLLELKALSSERLREEVVLLRMCLHDINNLLTVVLTQVELASHEHSELQAAVELLSLAGGLTGEARWQPMISSRAELERLLRAASGLLEKRFPAVAVALLVEPGVPLPNITGGALLRILLNLSLNAVTAMTGDGVLRISMVSGEGGVCLQVSDTGAGMESLPIDGSGLGLRSISHLLEQAGGSMSMQSRVGAGTVVSVFLPAG